MEPRRKRSLLWTPQHLGGRLAMWFDARDQGTLSFGTGVSEWRDKGPFARHLTAAGAAQPTWSATGLDTVSRPGITFDGTANVLASATFPLYAAATATLYLVCRVPSSATSRFIFVEASSSSANPVYGLRAGITTGSSLAALVRNDANTTLINNTVLATTVLNASVVIIGILDDGANLTPRINGTAGTPVAYTRSGALTPTRTSLGAFASTTTTNFVSGSFGEIVTCGALLATVDAQRVEGYLAARHGVTLPVTHPFATVPPYG